MRYSTGDITEFLYLVVYELIPAVLSFSNIGVLREYTEPGSILR